MNVIHSIQSFRERSREKFLSYARARHARSWLAAFSFLEASVFPIPPDLLLIAIVAARPIRWIFYAAVTTVASAAGGIAGYFIGLFLFNTIGGELIELYGLHDEMVRIAQLFEENAFWAIFSAAFTPIPYKAFTLSAGFFSINFLAFLFASVVGRGLRFFALGYIIKVFGDRFSAHIFRYFDLLTLAIVLAAVLLLLFLNTL